jgi:hypothetical protein
MVYMVLGGFITVVALAATVMLAVEVLAKAKRSIFTMNVLMVCVLWILVYFMWRALIEFAQRG